MNADDIRLAEIRRQFEQALALVIAANRHLHGLAKADGNMQCELATPRHLLDMAEDMLGDLEYLNRVAPEEPEGEAS